MMFSKLPRFTIDLDKLPGDTLRVSLLLERFEFDRENSFSSLIGNDLKLQARFLKSFPSVLFDLIENLSSEQGEDEFGNKFTSIKDYDYVELLIDPSYSNIRSIRLLGNTLSPPEQRTRYAIFGPIPNRFDPTTINIVSDIKDLSERTKEFFGSPGGTRLLTCVRELRRTVGVYRYLNSLNNPNLNWVDFVRTYFYPQPTIVQRPRGGFTFNELKTTPIKTLDEFKRETKLLANRGAKLDVVTNRQNGFSLTNAGAMILQDTSALVERINSLKGDPVGLLQFAYNNVLNSFDLQCLVQSALECIRPSLTCKQILRGLRSTELNSRIKLLFPNQPRIVELVTEYIDRNGDPETPQQMDDFLDYIEKFVDLEVLCDVASYLFAGGSIPTVSFKFLKITDIYATISLEIQNAILESIVDAIIGLIVGVLDDLASCDTLDAFVASAMKGEYSSSGNLVTDMQNVFNTAGDNITNSFGKRGQQFNEQMGKVYGQISNDIQNANITLDIDNDGQFIPVAGANIPLAGSLLVQEWENVGGIVGLVESVSSGQIPNISGSLFLSAALESGIRIAPEDFLLLEGGNPNATAILQNMLREVGTFELSSDGNTFNIRRISDDQLVDVYSGHVPHTFPVPTYNPEEFGRMFNTAVSLLSPGEMLELVAGEPSPSVREMINETGRAVAPNLSAVGDLSKVFHHFGKVVGIDRLRDQLVFLAAGDRNRKIPRYYCIEDDDRLTLREEILVRKGLAEEEVREKLEDITEKRRDRYNKLLEELSKGGDHTPEGLLDKVACGTGLMPNGTRPDIIQNQLNSTIDLMFEPLKMRFDREIVNYKEAISSYINVPKSSSPPSLPDISNNPLSSIFPDLTPPDQSLFELGQSPQNPLTMEKQRIPGGLFVQGFRLRSDKVSIVEQDELGALEVRLSSSLNTNSGIGITPPYPVETPRWLIKYREEQDNYRVDLINRGALTSKVYGLIPADNTFTFSGSLEQTLDVDTMSVVTQYSPEIVTRNSFYTNFMSSVASEALIADEGALRSYFSEKYSDLLRDTLTTYASSYLNNRLLQPIPEDNSSFEGQSNKTIVLDTVRFASAPTASQRKCKIDPHILDLSLIRDVVTQVFDLDCNEEEDVSDGVTPSRRPLNAAGMVGAVLSTVRVYVVEHILKTIFIYDQNDYNRSFSTDELLVTFISARLKEDVKRLGFWDQFSFEIDAAYEKLVTLDIVEEDEEDKLKAIIQSTHQQVVKKLTNLIGVEGAQGESFESSFVKGLPVVDVFSRSSIDIGRLPEDVNNNAGGFILERYVRLPSTSDGENGQVVTFTSFEQLVSQNPSLAEEFNNEESVVRFGLRIAYVQPNETVIGEESTNIYTLNLGGQSYVVDRNIADRESSYLVYEKIGEELYQKFSSFVISAIEKPIDELGSVEEIVGFTEDLFEALFKQELMDNLLGDPLFKAVFKYSLPTGRLNTLLLLHSSAATNSEEMRLLLEGTKLELKKLFDTLSNLGDYTYSTTLPQDDNATQFQMQFNSIGGLNPNLGSAILDKLLFLYKTPFQIIKGVGQILDPLVFAGYALKDAAMDGFLLPRFKRPPPSGVPLQAVPAPPGATLTSEQVQYISLSNGEPAMMQFSRDLVAATSIFGVTSDTGELYVKNEALQEIVGANSVTYKIKNSSLLETGVPIIDHTKVLELDENGDPTGKILSGPGKKGLRVPGAESLQDVQQRLDEVSAMIPLGPTPQDITRGIIGGLGLDIDIDIIDSVPILPGESISLPFWLTSIIASQLGAIPNPAGGFIIFATVLGASPILDSILPYYNGRLYEDAQLNINIIKQFGINPAASQECEEDGDV
jgi:hypothetical protein